MAGESRSQWQPFDEHFDEATASERRAEHHVGVSARVVDHEPRFTTREHFLRILLDVAFEAAAADRAEAAPIRPDQE